MNLGGKNCFSLIFSEFRERTVPSASKHLNVIETWSYFCCHCGLKALPAYCSVVSARAQSIFELRSNLGSGSVTSDSARNFQLGSDFDRVFGWSPW